MSVRSRAFMCELWTDAFFGVLGRLLICVVENVSGWALMNISISTYVRVPDNVWYCTYAGIPMNEWKCTGARDSFNAC